MQTRNFLGLILTAALGCAGTDNASAEPDEQAAAAESLHRGDAGLSCQRSYNVRKDKRVAQIPRDDVELIDTLVPHHQGAVEMADMELEHGQDADIKAMAQDMKDTQAREIEELLAIRQRLTGCTEITPLRDPHMQQSMQEMMGVSGAALDRMFLEEMIPHHASAVSFTHNALPNLKEADLEKMAIDIIDAQSMEIGHMHMELKEH